MRRILLGLSAVLFLIGSSLLYAQSTIPPGFPPGVFIGRGALDASPAATFQGAGDIVSGATLFWSCARSYSAAFAATSPNICDLVAVTGGGAVCTLKLATTGFVDLTAYCPGSLTPAAACAAASGGSCLVTKTYDQTGNNNHATTVTLAQMPTLTFSALNGLAGIGCVSASATRLTSVTNITQAQPFSMSIVYKRTTGTVGFAQLAANASSPGIGSSNTANNSGIFAGTIVAQAATDNVFHSVQGVFNGASGAINTDGTDATSQNAGAGAFSAEPIRLCRNSSGAGPDGPIMEVGMWPSAFDGTQRPNVNTNQHGANGYNF